MILKLNQLIEYQVGKFLWKRHVENVHQKLFLYPLLILVNNSKQRLHTRNCSKNRVF